jgi:hypothetical protein
MTCTGVVSPARKLHLGWAMAKLRTSDANRARPPAKVAITLRLDANRAKQLQAMASPTLHSPSGATCSSSFGRFLTPIGAPSRQYSLNLNDASLSTTNNLWRTI